MILFDRWRGQLEQLRQEGRYRALKTPAGHDFSSNDYLGYSRRTWPASTLSRSGAASRLLRGEHPIWSEVESRLAAWHRAETALVMTSGYVANEGLLGTVIDCGDVVFSDACNHASLIDGIRLSRAEKHVFRHNDLNDLEVLFRKQRAARTARQAWFVVTESLFGMEGDVAPLRELADLAELYQAYLLVDEAHATGCFGPTGSGLVDAGGFASASGDGPYRRQGAGGSRRVHCRIRFAQGASRQSLPPSDFHDPAAAADWPVVADMLDLAVTDEATRAALHERTRFFRTELSARRIDAGGSAYIVSIVLGADAAAVEAARRLQERGYDIRSIRPPTVPAGTARLRISVHADHYADLLRELANALVACLYPEGAPLG